LAANAWMMNNGVRWLPVCGAADGWHDVGLMTDTLKMLIVLDISYTDLLGCALTSESLEQR